MEHDERREHEEQHGGQRVSGAELEREVLARQGGDVREVAAHRAVSASHPLASPATRSGSWVETTSVAVAGQRRELAVEELRTLVVEGGEGLVEDEQVGVVEECPAQREPLHHPARVVGHPLAARLPEAEPLEQHADSLPPLRDPVEAAEQLEVLQRRRARGRAGARARGSRGGRVRASTSSVPRVGAARPARSRSRVVLPEPFAPGDDQAAAPLDREREVAQHRA